MLQGLDDGIFWALTLFFFSFPFASGVLTGYSQCPRHTPRKRKFPRFLLSYINWNPVLCEWADGSLMLDGRWEDENRGVFEMEEESGSRPLFRTPPRNEPHPTSNCDYVPIKQHEQGVASQTTRSKIRSKMVVESRLD